MTQATGKVSRGADRSIHLARGHGPSDGARPPYIRQISHLVAQVSGEAQRNMSNYPNISLHVTSGIVGDISALSGSSPPPYQLPLVRAVRHFGRLLNEGKRLGSLSFQSYHPTY